MKKQISFSTIKFKDLKQLVNLSPKVNDKVFDKWFSYEFTLSENDVVFLESLIEENQLRIPYYSEEELKMKFIGPLLNRVNFNFLGVTDWYERMISGEINGVTISGLTDYLVAEGYDEPELPYYFIQEYKPSRKGSDPEIQLVAELLIALEQNNWEEMIGTTIVGKIWDFILICKIRENEYDYFKSVGFNAMNIEDLKKLFIALQAVKADIKTKIAN